MLRGILSALAIWVFPLAAFGQVTCTATWNFDVNFHIYSGVGATETDALSRARALCMSSQVIDSYKHYCRNDPARLECNSVGACVSSASINSTGYPGSGHRNNWCRSQGFDGYDGVSQCVRSCANVQCVKVPIVQLGYASGHKNNFCIGKGYIGVSDPAGNGPSGYCFKGDPAICGHG